MPSFRSLLLLHGYAFLFFYVLGVQAGMPIPADPLLLIMGALAANRLYSVWLAFLVTVVAALAADLCWYEVGRRRGRSVLALLCKLSIEPDTCVQSTEANFQKRGIGTLLLAKFIPGMSLVSIPLAGALRIPRLRFLLADAGGTALWAGGYLAAGYLFHKQVDRVVEVLGLFGRRAGFVVLCLLAIYIGAKFLQRWRFRRELRINRIEPGAAFDLLQSGYPVTVVDLRNQAEVAQEGLKIAGALVLRPDDLRSRSHSIPPQHEVILYCS